MLYGIHSMEGSSAKEILTRHKHYTLSTDPYVVIVISHESPQDFIRPLDTRHIKCDVTHLGKTVEI